LEEWPHYPEFTVSDTPAKDAEELLSYKRAIVAKFSEEAITKSWLKVCEKLETLTKAIATKGTSGIPVLSLEDFLGLSKERQAEIKTVGALVIRGVIPREEAEERFRNLKTYVADNKDKVTGEESLQ
jgi:hypothetical protein